MTIVRLIQYIKVYKLLHSLRQNRHWLVMMMTSVLLMVWLTLSCQNCFAMEIQNAATSHASMDCCPSGMQQDQDTPEKMDGMTGNCVTANLMDQPVVAEDINLQLDDQTLLALSVYASDYPSSPSSGVLISAKQNPVSFSQRLFSSYRILLI